jgi:hypothetical protein
VHLPEKQAVKGTWRESRHPTNKLAVAEFNRGWPISANEDLALHGNLGKMLG